MLFVVLPKWTASLKPIGQAVSKWRPPKSLADFPVSARLRANAKHYQVENVYAGRLYKNEGQVRYLKISLHPFQDGGHFLFCIFFVFYQLLLE
jgi:hypothetical protein